MTTLLVVLGLALAVGGTVECARGRPPGRALLQALLVLQAVVVVAAVVLVVGGVDGVAEAGYLLLVLAVVPTGMWWALQERSRWSSGVLALAGVVLAVVALRLGAVG